MSLSENTEAIYISRVKYNCMLNRMKLKTTSHTTRYYFDILLHSTTMKYYITHSVDLACTHKDLCLVSTEQFNILLNREEDFIYTTLSNPNRKRIPFRFTVID